MNPGREHKAEKSAEFIPETIGCHGGNHTRKLRYRSPRPLRFTSQSSWAAKRRRALAQEWV
jgi:hypothetical protein